MHQFFSKKSTDNPQANALSTLGWVTQYTVNVLAVTGMYSKLGWSGERNSNINQTFCKQEDGWQIEIAWMATQDTAPKGVVIFCHPYFKFGLDYILNNQKAVYQHLLENGYHVVFFNFKGYGKSTYTFSNFSNYAEDIFVVTEWVKEQYPNLPINLYGYSLGGYWACCAAAMKPDVYQALVLDSPPATLFVPDNSAFVNFFKYSVQKIIGYFDLPGSRSLYEGILQKIQSPMLIFYGANDSIITKSEIEKIKEAKSDIEIISFANCKHLQASKKEEHVKNYLENVLNFLNKNPAAVDKQSVSDINQRNSNETRLAKF